MVRIKSAFEVYEGVGSVVQSKRVSRDVAVVGFLRMRMTEGVRVEMRGSGFVFSVDDMMSGMR
jgi:hypothetical protein